MVYQKTETTENRKREKEKLIFETAAKVFAKKGYNSTSVKDIAEEAGISVGTFYLYFKNKEDLFERLYSEMAKIINAVNEYAVSKTPCSAAEKFSRGIAASLWAYQQYRELARILLIEAVGLNPRFEQKRAEISKHSCNKMKELFDILLEKKVISVPDTEIAALAFEGTYYVVDYLLHQNDEQLDFTKHAYALAIYNLQALRITFEPNQVAEYIQAFFEELNQNASDYLRFSEI